MDSKVVGAVAISMLTACGSAHTTSTGTGSTGDDTGDDTGTSGDAGVGGDSASDGGGTTTTPVQNDGIYGSWFFETSDQKSADAIEFDEDGTYVFIILELTSSSSGKSQDETGTFTASDGTITFTPDESTCPSPQGVYQAPYTLTRDGGLTLTFGSTLINFVPEQTSSSGGGTTTGGGSSVETGCYSSDGTTFTPAPLAPVTN
jgi:hypothetical protein